MSVFGGYAIPAGVCIQASQTTILAEIAKFEALFAAQTAVSAGAQPHTDFDRIPETTRAQILIETADLKAKIDAMAIA